MLAAPPESHRATAADVAAASFNRLQQALRSLEEYGKLIDPAVAAEIERIRFRAYTLHRAVSITADSLARLADARLYVLVDGCANESAFASLIETLVTAGVHMHSAPRQTTPRPRFAVSGSHPARNHQS